MLDTSARLLRLLGLLQMRREWTGAALADRMNVGVRTVRRDIAKLRTLGYPVEAIAGRSGYRLGAGAQLPPLLFDDEETVAVAIGLRTAATSLVTGIEESSVRALAKLETLLPSRLRHRIALLAATMETVPQPGPTVNPETLIAVAGACRDQHQLRFDYLSHDGTASLRRVEPHRLVHTGKRWYLIAWDIERDAWRTYRVDRLTPRVPTGPRFSFRAPPDADLSAYLSRGVTTNPYRYRARITLHVPIRVAAERVSHHVGLLEARSDEHCTLHTGSNSLDELALYVGLFQLPCTVHEPSELIEHIRDLTNRLSAAIG
ncbi:YafY family protein [Mycobacterium sp. IS-1264]|uniref:helix-turn-helix transcriptional regulator n=1 Tax=Mycobacterium sp. IS-1264 TaxID=1834158 RepID=UPI00096FB869|nr:YafY family protein [Mycobacterium sp. IS-1264]OMC38393.1 DNA-binding transcriptional regulator [Mycobacterium sp. IS-1264]